MKLRTFERIRTERRKPVSSAGPAWKARALSEVSIQPFDLMSRRHPLSSIRASRIATCFVKQIARAALMTGRHQAAGHLRQASYFFFLATLRVFFAVFFTALFAFFAFLAFLAMMPS